MSDINKTEITESVPNSWGNIPKTPNTDTDLFDTIWKWQLNDVESTKELGDLWILIESWDIWKIKSDALIAPINSGGLWFGAIDNVIRNNSGDQFHKQVSNKLPLNHGDTVNATKQTNHNWAFENVLFVIDDLKWPLKDILYNALKAADKAGYNSVSIPIIRMWVMIGIVEKTPEEVVEQLWLGIKKFKDTNPVNLKKIIFVVYNDEKIKTLMENKLNDEKNNSSRIY